MPPFNAPKHRDYLHSLRMYVASAAILSSLGWGREGSADMLFEKTNGDPAVLIIGGKVVDDRLFRGPQGNWSIGNQYGHLKMAKYQFSIGQPDEDIFTKDYDGAFKTLSRLQSSITSSTNRKHLLIGESDRVNSIKFSTNVFETCPTVSPAFTFKLLPILMTISKPLLSKKPIVIVPKAVKPDRMTGVVYLSDLSTTPPVDAVTTSELHG